MVSSVLRTRPVRLVASLSLLVSILVLTPIGDVAGASPSDDLLLTEIVVTPTAGEMVEIHNPTAGAVDLTDVYLTDATFAPGGTFYYNIVTGSNSGGGGFADWNARFPAGASIAAGDYQTVALAGSDSFFAQYGVDPTYELFEDGASADAIPDMLEATPGSVNNQGGLSNSGEVVILYRWDGASDLVEDIDYAVWGDKAEAVDKTGVATDGPDADAAATMYAPDTAIIAQDPIDTGAHTFGSSWQRADLTEGTEAQSGGNGSFGSDETSENLSVTWGETAPTPNAATTLPPPVTGPPPADHLLLSEVVVTPTAGEMVEIHNPTATAIDLTDVYLTDATFSGGSFYYNIVTGAGAGGGGFADWLARFPAGASIAAGDYQTVALAGSDDFFAQYGVDPTYELFEDGASADAIPDMVEALPGSINNQGGLSNSGEVVILFSWNGTTDLVQDLDYALWGDKAEAIDKTGVSLDGPDADTDPSTYLADTSIGSQDIVAGGSHTFGNSWQRADLSEGAETKTGGNGLTGNDETSENLSVTWGETGPTPNAATTLPPPVPGGGGPGPLPAIGSCGDAFTRIYQIQGSADESPLFEQGVVTEGVVTAVLGGLGGFTIQDPAGDGNSDTSDGVFVFASAGSLAAGDAVRVAAHVDEFFGLTELTSLTAEDVITVPCAGGSAISPTAVSLPVSDDFEPLEGMLVEFAEMTVTDTFNLSRFGEVQLSSPGRLFIPTDLALPGDAQATVLDFNNRRSIIMDDGSTAQNPSPIPIIGSGPTLRLGETTQNLVGVVTCNFGCPKLVPTGPVTFSGSPRPSGPDDVGGDVKVAAFNVLNYWTSLDDGTNPGARGADSAVEFERQTQKLVAGISALDADIIGLQELENNGPAAIGALVDALNADAGSTVWAAVADPAYPGGLESTNAIKVGIIYRTDRVTTVGSSSASLSPDFALDRPPVAQTFDAGGELFTVVSNHFKSKSCTNTGPGEPFPDEADAGDGQGCFAARRTRQAGALLDFVAELQATSGDPDVIAVGDLNSYSQEDSIRALSAGGLVDLTASLAHGDRYSFVFFGQAGQLDYAFATPGLANRVTGVDMWHVNADEPRFLDYNTEFNPPEFFSVDEFRSSDHDVVLVGISNDEILPQLVIGETADNVESAIPSGSRADDRRLDRAVRWLALAADGSNWVDPENPSNGDLVLRLLGLAVRPLQAVSGVGVSEAIGDLVATAGAIAQTAVDRAVATEGDATKTFLAQRALANGQEAASGGNLDDAIGEFRRAFRFATHAVENPTFATFNASLNRGSAGELIADLSVPGDSQAATVAEIIQRTRPDVLLINEFDFDPGGVAAALFQQNYLGVSQGGAAAIEYPFVYLAPSNTGVPSGFDFDNSGSVGGGNDAFGFGFFEGQFAMVVVSMHPIHFDDVRTFQLFLWKDMPGALLPDDPAVAGPADWYSPAELEVFRLSSKSHWDVPIQVGRDVVDFLTSHPTPPVFDGPEDRNGTRNHDEIRFFADYVDPTKSGYIYDDDGGTGGLSADAKFVIAGDQNADPFDGDSTAGAAQQLLDSALINTSVTPSSEGGVEQAALQGGVNDVHIGDPAFDTADFSDGFAGNLRADYVLPSANMEINDAAVFWPLAADPLFALVGVFPFPSSDHRLVWVNISVR